MEVRMLILQLVLLFSETLRVCLAEPEDLYCGDKNCYDVLGVTRDSTRSELSKAYRRLAGQWHPDRFRSEEDKDRAEKTFRQIATAYELLKDDESREEYNYMLDHPEEMWRNYYRYYRRRVAPKVDIRIVVVVAITVISAVQYYSARSNYDDAIKFFMTVPKYRIKATEIAREEGMLKRDKKADRGKSKEQIKDEEERIIRQIVEDKMDIRGGYAKPRLVDVLWVQLVLLPYTLVRWLCFYLRWFYKFQVCGQDYGVEEKLYLIRRSMGLSSGQFDALEECEKEDFLRQELWIKDKYKEWRAARDDEMRIKMAQSGRFKQYRRYMRNHGSDRMTFDDS